MNIAFQTHLASPYTNILPHHSGTVCKYQQRTCNQNTGVAGSCRVGGSAHVHGSQCWGPHWRHHWWEGCSLLASDREWN